MNTPATADTYTATATFLLDRRSDLTGQKWKPTAGTAAIFTLTRTDAGWKISNTENAGDWPLIP